MQTQCCMIKPVNTRRILCSQTPLLSPSHVSQRAPTTSQEEQPRSGPHRIALCELDIECWRFDRRLWPITAKRKSPMP